MKEVQRLPANRCFGGHCPKKPDELRDQKIKEAFLTLAERRKANREIDFLLKQFRGKRIIDLLPVIKLRFPQILAVALERVERRHYEPGSADAIFLANFKASLKENQP